MSITNGKRKRGEEEQEVDITEELDDVDMTEDPTQRSNALFVQGSPISHLPTARLFAYATHFDAHPLGLEWIDDNTCVFVFETNASARAGFRYLQKAAEEEPDLEGFVTAKPIPMTFWPPEEQINKSLGMGEGLKGVIRMRWASLDDVKKKGAKHESEFYRKHGNMAGKELFNGRETQGATKRRKTEDPVDLEVQREILDRELDDFLDSKDDEGIEEPPSKMRSDYIAADGRTLLERTSIMRLHSVLETDLASRISTHRTTAPLPRRARRNLEDRLWSEGRVDSANGKGTHRKSDTPGGGGTARPRKTQQELDDELDAFLKGKE
ncbi:hypothetical protein E1B28_003963 [Marasmius oreades]|uniref:Chromatin target of PRMT1 protein C-terminal domain-containing protein n=1 Tax=Marasmius oreades TaxID=181124 RepID=A0A9P7UXN3_9AGAR|nr:uncharacterized protein E1B28_003963 [Marasmius oreades]KAG7096535.1 hypothetical protein E1B28_003963 [Marasmius oreades]